MSAERILVVGAGAAGLWFAARAAGLGHEVVVLEKTPRAGTKVLASGGSHCNLTTTLPAREAAALFGPRASRFLAPALSLLGPEDVRRRFAEWGVPTVEAPLEKVFPASGRAKDVRDALERAARNAGAVIHFECPVRAIRRDGSSWVVSTEGGPFHGARLVLAVGGCSVPKSGTTGDGYPWLEALGLPLVPPSPALVPLRTNEAWVKALTGIAWPAGELRLLDQEGRVLGRRRRPLLFTHEGISGPGAMDLSGPVGASEAAGSPAGHTLLVDLFPDEAGDRTRERLLQAGRQAGSQRLQSALPEARPRRLFDEVLRQAGLRPETFSLAHLSREARHLLVQKLHGLSIPIVGTRGLPYAEVTRGGLDLFAVDPRSMRVNGFLGLQVIGELLDVDGPIGGLNFQAAFATAEIAALAGGS